MSGGYNGLLRDAVALLRAGGIEGGARDARLLLAGAMGIAAGRLTVELGGPVAPGVARAFGPMLDARLARKPVSHILGRRAFWSGEFEVTEATLAPRPETEMIVEQALAGRCSTILDLGTGTGCIAISLLGERPDARATATDIDPETLTVAARNAARHGVADRLHLLRADWFAGVEGRFDLIASNPPYIAAAELTGLSPEVRDHEPARALSDGADGLTAYRAIAAGAAAHLTPGGRLLVEIGAGQAAEVCALFATAGFGDLRVHPDLDGRDRVVAARTG